MYTKNFLIYPMLLVSLLAAGCSTEPNNSKDSPSAAANNLALSRTTVTYSPTDVVIYPNQQAVNNVSYEKIAATKIALYNQYDIRRQEAQINQILKKNVRTLGGNGAILLNRKNKKYLYVQIIRVHPIAVLPSTSAANQELAAQV